MHQQPQESIWGTINNCIEIALNIYMIVAVDEKGLEHTGIMAHKDTAANTLSSKATDLAKENGDWLYFDENTKDAAMYEVLQQRMNLCKKVEAAVQQQMEEIKLGSQIQLPDYFGECPVPQDIGKDAVVEKIRNGVFRIESDGQVQFAVHKSIADNYLTPMAMQFGTEQGEYQHYNSEHCAVLLHELKPIFEEVEQLVISPESLYATLHQNFGEYVKNYNQLMPEGQEIPIEHAPANLFLTTQLEQGQGGQEEETVQEPYGEDVDFGFEM